MLFKFQNKDIRAGLVNKNGRTISVTRCPEENQNNFFKSKKSAEQVQYFDAMSRLIEAV